MCTFYFGGATYNNRSSHYLWSSSLQPQNTNKKLQKPLYHYKSVIQHAVLILYLQLSHEELNGPLSLGRDILTVQI